MIKINKLRLRNLDNKHLKKARGYIGRNLGEITIKMKTIVRKPLMIKIIKLRLRNSENLTRFEFPSYCTVYNPYVNFVI